MTGEGWPLFLMPYLHGFGHTPMGGFCALACALAHPERAPQLIIISSPASASAIQRCRGLPRGSWLTGRDRFHCPASVRDVWSRTIFANRLDYRAHLTETRVPALIGVGRHDPQAPVGCSQEIAPGMPGARLVIFEHSGHRPFAEERDLFKQTLAEFLA